METSVENLDKEIIKLRQKQERVRKNQKKELIPKFKKEWIGKCFKYRNSYGGSRPSWWLYAIIIDIPDVNFYRTPAEPYFHTVSFQKCCNGNFTIKEDDLQCNMNKWKEITPSQFNIEYKKILKELSMLTKRK